MGRYGGSIGFIVYIYNLKKTDMIGELPLGLRNNNPGNLKNFGGTPYKGEILPNSGTFRKFQSMAYGYRAMFHLLLIRYMLDYKLTTIRKIITRWAPSTENDTDNYIQFVSGYVGILENQEISSQDSGTILQIGRAISKMENGLNANETDLQNGWNMLVSDYNSLPFEELLEEGKNPNDFRNSLLIGAGMLAMGVAYIIGRKKGK